MIMDLFAKLAHKIGNNLVNSQIIKAEDIEIYIYGINQILVSILNIASALILGAIFGVFYEIAVFMAAYIPIRTFAGGYHAKTPLRCYVFSMIMLVVVSIGLRYFCVADGVYYVILGISIFVILILSPIEDKNKPLNEIEHRIYKKKTTIIVVVELVIYLIFKFVKLDNLSEAIIYSFAVLSIMFIVGKIKKEAK